TVAVVLLIPVCGPERLQFHRGAELLEEATVIVGIGRREVRICGLWIDVVAERLDELAGVAGNEGTVLRFPWGSPSEVSERGEGERRAGSGGGAEARKGGRKCPVTSRVGVGRPR